MFKKALFVSVSVLLMTACQTTTSYIDAADKETNLVAALSYADFKEGANKSLM